MGTTPIYGFPYPDPSDLVANYPALGQQLAEDIEAELLVAGKILQVIQGTTSTQVSTSSLTAVTTGLTATITPSSATNKVFVIAQTAIAHNNTTNRSIYTLFRGTVAGTTLTRSSALGANIQTGLSLHFLDTPNTTSAQIYTLGFAVNNVGISAVAQANNFEASIVLMEVSA